MNGVLGYLIFDCCRDNTCEGENIDAKKPSEIKPQPKPKVVVESEEESEEEEEETKSKPAANKQTNLKASVPSLAKNTPAKPEQKITTPAKPKPTAYNSTPSKVTP